MSRVPLLDWRGPWHWGKTEVLCGYCREPTWLRDDDGLPAHKVCAEAAAARGSPHPGKRQRRSR